MAVVWALLFAIPAAWGLGLVLAQMIDPRSNMLPAMTIASAFAVLGSASVVPWATPIIRLRLMQGLALLGVALMLVTAT